MALTYQQLLITVPLVLRAGNVPSIVGEAGLGKTALVEEVAKKMNAKLFTTVVSLSEKGDLAIPVPPLTSDSFVETKNHGRLANVQFGYSETLISIIRYSEENPQKKIIWFLDEFNRGPQAVQSELMNLVLQRQINSLRLPETVKIVIAENPDNTMEGFENSEYAVSTGDAAIKDRTVRLVMTSSTSEWLAWAKKPLRQGGRSNINPLVIDYLTRYPSRLIQSHQFNLDLNPTPRAWERVSKDLDQLQEFPREVQEQLAPDLFSGDLGTEIGVSFAEFVQAHGIRLQVNDMIGRIDLEEEFQQLEEADKLSLLREWLEKYPETLAKNDGATNFSAYLADISPDGQYALVRQVGENDELLNKMYSAAKENPTGAVAELYETSAQIATYGDKDE
ncbi:ATP-binding protein [Limosilactobacillus fastidiosus]|uniref:ATP-binding protein n=1 Tax=Limosilactobacillus fastidiosus TaxID=2759855 RepID=A0A7W3YBS5_9LACO|nr:ATP-binding protein [Limosilactobacillus fastidiosus]MBB1062592.1 ATP-binding protein [Limosilactobacillus fastidiosus]MBB1085455.1 ATP-binding protein [Limosilactobacillus fastidiosus]MCD7083668.1 ATP-binding protein [Limosilactobacillus fastidiosus]MCD7085908.1 ATP-binding protein [Limosilactobacillus fastidiosus]MCD7114448.1 ATP-binding protein [Limosilactobacillus fastidiosus]